MTEPPPATPGFLNVPGVPFTNGASDGIRHLAGP